MYDWELWTVLDAGAVGPIIALSLAVSPSATTLATLLGTPLGAALAVYRFPGRQILVVTFNALLGLPPVVVGLAPYLLLSRSGSLGTLSLLFTPGAMVLAQTVLALPTAPMCWTTAAWFFLGQPPNSLGMRRAFAHWQGPAPKPGPASRWSNRGRQRQHGLREHHGARCEQQAQRSERT